jgi:hypothetical protein
MNVSNDFGTGNQIDPEDLLRRFTLAINPKPLVEIQPLHFL